MLFLCAGFGCVTLVAPGDLPSSDYFDLPASPEELRLVADRIYRDSRDIDELVRARTALKKADEELPEQFGTLWRLARVDAVLARMDEARGEGWAQEGLKAARSARALEPDRIEGHLYAAVCTGMLAKYRPADGDELTERVVELAQRAVAVDPHYAGGEARRVLGAIYIYAPPWPAGVGDLDEAIEILEGLAADHPEAPLNLYFLAEAYRRGEQRDDALRLYRRVRSFPPRGVWRLEGRHYRAKAREYIRQLQ